MHPCHTAGSPSTLMLERSRIEGVEGVLEASSSRARRRKRGALRSSATVNRSAVMRFSNERRSWMPSVASFTTSHLHSSFNVLSSALLRVQEGQRCKHRHKGNTRRSWVCYGVCTVTFTCPRSVKINFQFISSDIKVWSIQKCLYLGTVLPSSSLLKEHQGQQRKGSAKKEAEELCRAYGCGRAQYNWNR
jgi:hypothetical protein